VAYHQAMLATRRLRRDTEKSLVAASPPQSVAASPSDLAEQRDEARRLRELLDLLPPLQREVIRQRVYEGKPFREIAADMDCPLNTALARMHDGLKRLRLLWEQPHA